MCPPPFQEETGRPIEKEKCIHVTEVYDMVVYVVFQTMNLSFSNLKMTEDALEGDQNDNIKRSVKSAGTCYRMIILWHQNWSPDCRNAKCHWQKYCKCYYRPGEKKKEAKSCYLFHLSPLVQINQAAVIRRAGAWCLKSLLQCWCHFQTVQIMIFLAQAAV